MFCKVSNKYSLYNCKSCRIIPYKEHPLSLSLSVTLSLVYG